MKINRTIPIILVKLTLFICLPLILCACVLHEQYPSDWAALEKPRKVCLNIPGKYDNYSAMSKPFLSYLLIGQGVIKSSNLDKTNYVQINKGDNDELIVTVWNENTKHAEKIYKKDEYACSDEGIEISKRVDPAFDAILGLSWEKVTLIKATDGSLVVKYKGAVFGLLGALLPFAADEIRYYKYSQKK